MKVTVERTGARDSHPPPNPPLPLDLSQKPSFPRKQPRRKTKTAGTGIRLKRDSGAQSGKKSRPETPLLGWKFDKTNAKNDSVEQEEEKGKSGRRFRAAVSARKLGAALWRLHLPEFQTRGGQWLGLQPGGGDTGALIHDQHVDRVHQSPVKNHAHSPHSVSGPRNGLPYKFEPSFQFSNSAMEGITKWDPVGCKMLDEPKKILDHAKPLDHQPSAGPVITALETELERARARINELETERKSSKKKLKQFLQKLSEERATWRSREHEKVRAVIDDVKGDLSREKKNRQKLEIVNSKLVSELADAKLSAKRYLQEYEKERKARELIEEVCDELAKEIGEDKAEVEALKRESRRLCEELDEERKMLQMAEVWREERVQMKLIDAKVMLEDKYNQMNQLVADLESYLNSVVGRASNVEEMKKAEFLRQMASSVNIQDVRELTYEPPNPDEIFFMLEEANFGESNEGEVEPCGGYSPVSHSSKIHTVTPEVKMLSKDRAHQHPTNTYLARSGELEEDASEWETVSHPEDQGSSYSPDGSNPSINRNYQVSNISRTGTEWERSGGEETPIMEVTEVNSALARQLKKASSVSRLWKSNNVDNFKIISVDGVNERLSNRKLSNGFIMSPDRGSGKDGLSPHDLASQWSSPDSGNPHITRGMKGCIEWPRNSQKSSLKARLLEARMESQKLQLRQVLKQKI